MVPATPERKPVVESVGGERLPLFRAAATDAARGDWTGSVILSTPLSALLLTLFSLLMIVSIAALLAFGHYSKRATVSGLVEPVDGVIRVFAPEPGVIASKHVVEGQQVKQGDPLYVISAEKMLVRDGHLMGAKLLVVSELRDRGRSLESSTLQTEQIYAHQNASLSQRKSSFERQIEELLTEINLQEHRVDGLNVDITRFQVLTDQGFFAPSVLAQKRGELIDQDAKLHALRRTLDSLKSELDGTRSELSAAPMHLARDIAELNQQKSVVMQDLASSEASRESIVSAPCAGTVTAVMGEVGQVAGTQALLTIIPLNSRLQVKLFVPTHSAGFIVPKQSVLLRFAAFPYQKFGQYRGVVESRALAAISAAELPAFLQSQATQASESFYPVTVSLDSQSVFAYGKVEGLTAGLVLEADVIQDRRALGEWLFEPLLSLRGKF